MLDSTNESRRILDAVPVMITRKDTENRVITVNEAVVDYLGIPREEIEGSTAWDLFPDYGDEFHENDRQVIESGEPITGEIQELTTPAGNDRWIKTDIVPYRTEDGEVDGVLVVSEDVSDLKDRERELARQNERLNAFTSLVSHDLRNPLAVATGRVELAAEECSSDHLQAARDALTRMDVLIEKLLSLAREGTTVTERKPLDLASLIASCWATVDTADATLVVDVDRTVEASESRLKQVFENLFRNAVEHGGPGVTVTVDELADGFAVADDGPGIPGAHRDTVFEAGYSASRDGTGFGLSIVKEIVEAHGWEISLADGEPGGARFEISGVEFVAE